ncbi:outer membrane receptor protein involved in Fe transport [Sphingomonas vulcanisoli]|uniref:Outer membrane receptor protein involved in Fe transport n=1 Tax=Sphingomonas vulcanisoli TaxID=1658060 RepID=A0ABX0TRM9_9SPHN|nr:TonB-dependent receptor [Sphingomonas vulcanisoli]NIJ08176.1 outer membrane receptor protein involved in Fe transport [Sphingomonas vulcanisoli]
MGALPVTAAPSLHFDLPGGSLAQALAALSRQGSIDVGGSDPAISATGVRPLHGTMSAARALDRLLAGTPFMAEPVGNGGYRLVRRPAQPARAMAPRPVRIAAQTPAPPDEIIVLGSKRQQPLFTSPGSTEVIAVSDGGMGPTSALGERWLLQRTPVLQSTEVGEGRNKLFIRGVADSSFTGPTQATAGIYFGDVRVGYDGPDPNLNLYDVDRVEILEGPQGTLYGAGSIGGVIRIEPRAPQLEGPHASLRTGVSETGHGSPSYDSAGMVDLSLVPDRLGVRVVGYRSRDGGYIDAPNRKTSDINPLTQTGFRGAVRARPFDGITIDASYLRQTSEQPDLQYADGGLALGHLATLAQPFSDRYKLARGVAEKVWGSGLTFRISGGVADHHLAQRFEATRPGVANPSAYDDTTDIRLDTVEARLSRSMADGRGWVIGASGVWSTTGSERTLGPLSAPRDLIGVTNRTREKAGFGEITLPLKGKFLLSAGLRFTVARMDGEPSRRPVNSDFLRGSTARRLDPDVGFSVPVAHDLIWFGQYQQGFRTGGLAVAQGAGRVATYQSDTIRVVHSGVRYRHGRRIRASIDLSYARWDDIQADLIGRNGLPLTANVGNGIILAVEANAEYGITSELSFSGAVLFNHSRLTDPAPSYVSSGDRPLPASPKWTATGALAWHHPFSDSLALRAEARLRYTGRSRLGVGPVLDIPYGNYTEVGTIAALEFGRYEASLGIQNLLNVRANRFAIGNPFAIARQDETTPLRPRTVRLGFAVHY